MRSPRPKPPWSRLVAVARAASDDREYIFVPYGFSDAVVALALGRTSAVVDLTAAYAGRALFAAWTLAVSGVLLNLDHLLEFILQAD